MPKLEQNEIEKIPSQKQESGRGLNESVKNRAEARIESAETNPETPAQERIEAINQEMAQFRARGQTGHRKRKCER